MLEPIDPKTIRWDELTFAFKPTAFMYVAQCPEPGIWDRGRIEPFGEICILPAAGVLNYGQGIFEGMKAYSSHDNQKIFMFRPEKNAERMADGCRRLCIPPIPKEIFMEGVVETAKKNRDYVPPYRAGAPAQGALYLRPLVVGTAPLLGVNPAASYTFFVFTSPVGPYFKGGVKPIKLMVSQEYHRAAPGGTGAVKVLGNYAGSLLPGKIAKQAGYAETIYLDAKEDKYVEEVGAANFFCVKNNTLLTPELDGCILPGITRRSVIQLAKEHFHIKVEERKVTIEEALTAEEAFASGTAAVVSPIGLIAYKGKDYIIHNQTIGSLTQKLYTMLVNIQHGAEPDIYGWRYEVK